MVGHKSSTCFGHFFCFLIKVLLMKVLFIPKKHKPLTSHNLMPWIQIQNQGNNGLLFQLWPWCAMCVNIILLDSLNYMGWPNMTHFNSTFQPQKDQNVQTGVEKWKGATLAKTLCYPKIDTENLVEFSRQWSSLCLSRQLDLLFVICIKSVF